MRRAIVILLALLLVLSLAACGGGGTTTPTPEPTQAPTSTPELTPEPTPEKPEDVKNVELLIDSIRIVTIQSKEAIENAEKEYRYLSEYNKALVSNYSTLLRAKDTYSDVFNEFLLGEWVYSYTATGDSKNYTMSNGDYFFHKNDKIELVYKLNEGGTADETTYNISRDRSSSSSGPGWSVTWKLSNDTITIHMKYLSDEIGNYEFKINYEEGTLTEIDTGREFIKRAN